MRLAIFIGLLYIAYAINPEYMTSLEDNILDLFLVGFVFWGALIGDINELLKQNRK